MACSSWRDTSERRKTSPLVRRRAHDRHAKGFVATGKVYGYSNVKSCGGCGPSCKHPSTRVVNEAQAAVVRRVFQMTSEGLGLQRIRNILSAEGLAGPRGKWVPTGVREILYRRDYLGQSILNRTQRARTDDEKNIRVEQAPGWSSVEANPMFPEAWMVRRDEALRVVSDELWTAAHQRIAETRGQFLRNGNRLIGQREGSRGLFLLSGLLSCDLCRGRLVATRRGRKSVAVYVCANRRDRGAHTCDNTSGVPAADLHMAVVATLRETFTPASFKAHLANQAGNVQAREHRAAERAHLLAELPKMAAAESRLVRRIGLVEDDSLVGALKVERAAAKAKREKAEQRVAELEGIERDLAADQADVEQLLGTWRSWSEIFGPISERVTGFCSRRGPGESAPDPEEDP